MRLASCSMANPWAAGSADRSVRSLLLLPPLPPTPPPARLLPHVHPCRLHAQAWRPTSCTVSRRAQRSRPAVRPASAAGGAASSGASGGGSEGGREPLIDVTYDRPVGLPQDGMNAEVAEALKRVQAAMVDVESNLQVGGRALPGRPLVSCALGL